MANEVTPFTPRVPSPLLGKGQRRHLPQPPEQARRVAWGRRWGAIMSAHAQTYKRQGG